MCKLSELTLINLEKNLELSEMPRLHQVAPPNLPRSRESERISPETLLLSTRKKEPELLVLCMLVQSSDLFTPEQNLLVPSEDNSPLTRRVNVSRRSERDRLTSLCADTALELDKAIFKSI